ncbi:MAG: hypothetical protein M0D54_10275 [Hyphomonadaceae bacterium JAD_PAG50586_4]|nr:MAG: hypothetical protein M0D54_10275 [Hyphomonadaceae bacterium JAD_PAG50586_4]
MRAAILVAASLMAAGCASTGETPDWLAERSATADEAYPDLHAVPRTHDANVDQAHWAAIEAEMLATGQAVRANPRAAPAAQTETPTAFLEEAQRDLEETRQSHTP